MPSLRISVEGQVFEATMPQRAVRIGSAASADVCIALSSIAPEHCVVEPLPNGALKVKDSNSGRGTRVNGNTIRQVSVNPGDEILVGAARIRYIPDSERVVATPKPIPVQPVAAAPAKIIERRGAPERRRPGNASVKPPVERRRSVRRTSDLPRSASAPEADAQARGADATSMRARRATKSSPLPWVLGAAAVIVVGLVLALSGKSSDKDAGADQARMQSARALVEAHDYEGARAALQSLRGSKSSAVAREAREQLRALASIERTIQADLDERWLGRLDLTSAMLARVAKELRDRHGSSGEVRAKDFAARVRTAQKEWLNQRLEGLKADAAQAAPRHDFVSMLAAWDRLERSAPAGVDVAAVVEEGRTATRAAAVVAAATLQERAREFADKNQRDRALTILENALPGFEGLPARETLTQTIATIQAEAAAASVVTKTPDPTAPDTPGPTVDTPKPDPVEDDATVIAAVRKAVAEHAQARDFAKAAATAREGKLPGLATDLERATSAFNALRAHINTQPKTFRNMSYSKGLRLDVLNADDTGFTGAIRGGSSTYRWARVRTSFFGQLTRRWKPEGAAALDAAALLLAVGDAEAADTWMVNAGQSGADTLALFAALARWRDEELPEGGYVLHEKRYVTPDQREHLIREARIAEALTLLESNDSDKRAAAYATMFEIGEPAAKRFRSALDRRRARLIEDVAGSKSFTSNKYKKTLYRLLKERRVAALALIRNAKAYPYPNPQKKNQKEVEALVDKVRQIWERPFELVVELDKTLTKRLTEVTELDETISKLDNEYEPDLGVLRDKISAVINMPAYTPDGASEGARTYSLKALGFNERVVTTATKEERNNVRAVNDYRMMMGMRAVKINERLTRAARGHSRHMNRNGYFAHNVPAGKGANGQNRSPGNRAKTQGYGGGVGENIAMGTWTGYDAFRAWFGSSGHHRNMLGRWTEMGAGRSNGSWWTQLFGSASGRSLKLPDDLPAPEPAFAPEPEDDTGRPVGPPGGRVPDEVPPNEGELDEDDLDTPEDGADDGN